MLSNYLAWFLDWFIYSDEYVAGDLDVAGGANFHQNLNVDGDIEAAHVFSGSGAWYSAFYGLQLGATFANPEPIYAAVSDNGMEILIGFSRVRSVVRADWRFFRYVRTM